MNTQSRLAFAIVFMSCSMNGMEINPEQLELAGQTVLNSLVTDVASIQRQMGMNVQAQTQMVIIECNTATSAMPVYMCKYPGCFAWSALQSQVKEHCKNHTAAHTCSECGYHCKYLWRQKDHQARAVNEHKKRAYWCTQCTKIFVSRCAFNLHNNGLQTQIDEK